MNIPKPEKVQEVRNTYPAGTKVKLLKMDSSLAPPIGTCGEVTCVDDLGTIHIKWSNGSCLGAVYGEDIVEKISL